MIRQSIYTIVAGFVKTYLRHSFGVSTFSLSSMISFSIDTTKADIDALMEGIKSAQNDLCKVR